MLMIPFTSPSIMSIESDEKGTEYWKKCWKNGIEKW